MSKEERSYTTANHTEFKAAGGTACDCCGKTTKAGVSKYDVVLNRCIYTVCPSCLALSSHPAAAQARKDGARVPTINDMEVYRDKKGYR